MKRNKSIFFLLGFSFLTMILRKLADSNPEIVEQFYSRGFFQGIRWVIDHTISFIPFPLIYLFFVLVFGVWIFHYRKVISPVEKWNTKLLLFVKMLGVTFLLLYTSFHWLWGFNYARIPIETQMGFTPNPLTKDQLEKALKELTPQLLIARSKVPNVSDDPLDESYIKSTFEKEVLTLVKTTFKKYNYPINSNVNARLLKPKGLLKGFGASGIYFPFVGESNMDTALHPLLWPEVLAHEFSHAYGFGDEGTCSFIAYLCLKDATDPFLHYAGMLEYWRTLATNYLRYEPELYRAFRDGLPTGLVNDLDAINERSSRYRAFFPKFKRVAYNAYLKSQGIDEGIENYNRVLMLVEAFETK